MLWKILTVKNQFNGDAVLTLWKKHFEGHLNTSFSDNENALLVQKKNTPILVNNMFWINKDEIKKAISKLKRRKTPRYDKISSKVLKAGGKTIVEMFHKIFNSIWSQEKNTRMIVSPNHEKRDRLLRDNYRAISPSFRYLDKFFYK